MDKMQNSSLADKMTGGEVKEGGKEGKERPALPVGGYEPPSWAGKAAPGLHLDVLKVLHHHYHHQHYKLSSYIAILNHDHHGQLICNKKLMYFTDLQDTKLIQKLMIDEKNYYLFGRNHQACDFVVDHGSCSRWDNHL